MRFRQQGSYLSKRTLVLFGKKGLAWSTTVDRGSRLDDSVKDSHVNEGRPFVGSRQLNWKRVPRRMKRGKSGGRKVGDLIFPAHSLFSVSFSVAASMLTRLKFAAKERH